MKGLASPVTHGKTLRFSGFLLATMMLIATPTLAGVNRWTTSGPFGVTVTSLAIDPMNPDRVYAGDGQVVFQSRDGGLSWTLSLGADPGFGGPSGLAIDPLSSSNVYAATNNGVFKSIDAGGSWAVVGPSLPNARAYSLAIDPVTPSTVYAGTAGGLFKSTNGGSSWSGRLLAASIYNLVFSLQTPSTIFGSDFDNSYYYALPSLLTKSTDGGATWNHSNSGIYISPGALAIDPTNPSTLYAGNYYGGVYKSVDAGSTWRLTSTGLTGVDALVIDPRNPSTLYAASFRGVFRSTDGGASWHEFNSGLTNRGVRALAIDRTGTRLHAGTFFGGVFDYQIATNVPCAPAADSLCLLGNRFQVTLQAADPRSGRTGIGQAVPQGDRFGYFSLPDFTGDPTFPEVFVKMVDATSAPSPFGGSFWVFYGGLTDLRYAMTVIDTVTGEVKSYRNDPANPTCGGADTSAFKNIDASGAQLTVATPGPATSLAAAEGTDLLLIGNRFRVSLSAVDPRTGNTAVGQAMPQGDRFGYFSLPDFTGDPTFPEVFVKMAALSSGVNWVFHAGLTDLQYTMTMTDTATGLVRIYQNDRSDPFRLCGGIDAFSDWDY